MIIGVDLDSTLVDLPIVESVSNHLQKDFSGVIYDWSFSQFPPEFKTTAQRFFSDPAFMCALQPFEGVKEKIRQWHSEGHEIVLLTARNRSIREPTIEMITTHFPEIKTIDFVNQGESKKSLMSKYQLERWIDDAPHDILDSLELGINSFLISNDKTPYNHYIKHGNPLLRISSSVSEITHL